MKKLTLGLESFEKIRKTKDEYIYIDKTQLIHQLITNGSYYFLSRPRRFGKSLLCSTFSALFRSKKKLFEGLWIEQNAHYDWEKHPVIHINFSILSTRNPESFCNDLINLLSTIAKKYNTTIDPSLSLARVLANLVVDLSSINSVVIIIDEYDKPILDHIDDPTLSTLMRAELKAFFTPIKGLDQYLKFVFFTGITKFAKTSLFSGLNNITDITFDKRYATLVGYTKSEIDNYLHKHLKQATEALNITNELMHEQLKAWYNGYRFYENTEKVYNPYSVMTFLDKQKFGNYWFNTATPSFLIKLFKKYNYPIIQLENVCVHQDDIVAFDVEDIDLAILLFQTGYLTIVSYDDQTEHYTLSYPNKEVRRSLFNCILKHLSSVSYSVSRSTVAQLHHALSNNDIDRFTQLIYNFFTQVPYTIQIPKEKYYQSLFFVIARLLGADIDVEVATNLGRIDALIETKTTIYIF